MKRLPYCIYNLVDTRFTDWPTKQTICQNHKHDMECHIHTISWVISHLYQTIYKK